MRIGLAKLSGPHSSTPEKPPALSYKVVEQLLHVQRPTPESKCLVAFAGCAKSGAHESLNYCVIQSPGSFSESAMQHEYIHCIYASWCVCEYIKRERTMFKCRTCHWRSNCLSLALIIFTRRRSGGARAATFNPRLSARRERESWGGKFISNLYYMQIGN